MSEKVIQALVRTGIRGLMAIGGFGVLCYLAIDGQIETNAFVPIITLMIGYYYPKGDNNVGN